MDKSDSYNLFGAQSGFDMSYVFTPRKDPEQPSGNSSSAYSAAFPSSFSLFSGAARPSSSGWQTFTEDVVSTRRLEFTSPPRPMQPETECMPLENQAFTPSQMYTNSLRRIQPEPKYITPNIQAFMPTQMYISPPRKIQSEPGCLSPENRNLPQTHLFTSPTSLLRPQRNTTAKVFVPTRWSPARQSPPSQAASHVSHQRTGITSQPMGRPVTRAIGFSGPPSVCVFCKTNGEPLSQYGSHVLKDQNGRVTCPILRRYTCPICGASGDTAHTLKYCPLNSIGF